jgi:putative alpha-1,2-mannosidase
LSPLFPSAVVKLPNGRNLRITARHAAEDAKYIQNLKINGKASAKLWLTVDELKSGCSLDYVMGTQPNTGWGVTETDALPSFEKEAAAAQPSANGK